MGNESDETLIFPNPFVMTIRTGTKFVHWNKSIDVIKANWQFTSSSIRIGAFLSRALAIAILCR